MLKKNYKTVCNIASSVLILVLLILQFWPGYWTCQGNKLKEDGSYETESASVQGYIWMPTEYSLLEDYFEDLFGKNLNMNDIVMMPIITLACGVLCIIFTVIKKNKSRVAILPALIGAFGIHGYLSYPIYRLNGMWVVHFVLCVLILAVALGSIVATVTKRIIDFRKELKDIAGRG